nr:ribulose-phosphate 3-epimerase [Clostridia bacterium]
MIKVSPSVLSCDLSRLSDAVREVELAGADMVHLDVMDGVFVNNITLGIPVIRSLRDKTGLTFDVHLMIVSPERYIDGFIEAGADILTVHIEACEDVRAALLKIRELGCRAGLSVKPGTPIESVYEYLELCDMILVMTVEPGFGGQALIPATLDKVKTLRAELGKRGLDIDIQVDGGISERTAPEAKRAGANVLVAGSAIFGAEDKSAIIKALKTANIE